MYFVWSFSYVYILLRNLFISSSLLSFQLKNLMTDNSFEAFIYMILYIVFMISQMYLSEIKVHYLIIIPISQF